jgi:hypothetical protein
MEAELVRHLGGNPSFVQKLLIERLVNIRLRLDAFEGKFTTSTSTDLDRRVYGALQNAFRLTAREIGIEPHKPRKSETLAGHLAEKRAGVAQ